jgi:hypothetical protein
MKMAANYQDIEMAFDFVNSGQPYEYEAYLNNRTGEIYFYSEYEDSEEELPENINDETLYISLPHKNNLNLGKNLVLKFASQHLPDEAEKIATIFSRKGAYSKFKYLLETKDYLEKWYGFESNIVEKSLREWCEFNKISVND